MCVLTAVLLTICFPPFGRWYLAYVALVPWLLALAGESSRRWTLLWGWLGGLIFWAVNLYWLWWITLLGYAAAVLYLSVYWLVAACLIRAAVRRNWPLWLVTPVIWVALEYARAYVISGFPWFYLAHSQYARVPLIQIADLTGHYGLSFFVAMVNGAIADLFSFPLFAPTPGGARLSRSIVRGLAACLLALAGLLSYGSWRLGQQATQPGPVIGIVQQAFPIFLHRRSAPPETIFNAHLQASEAFVGAGCDLVIWPETMLPRGLNPEMLERDLAQIGGEDLRALAAEFFGPEAMEEKYSVPWLRQAVQRIIDGSHDSAGEEIVGLKHYARQIEALSKRLGCPLLAGGATVHYDPLPLAPADRWVARNSALWFDADWRASAEYAKMHLVPFSEYVPFKAAWRWLYRSLRWFVPPVMEQLEPGREKTIFQLSRPGGAWRLCSPICYEGTFARICRKLTVREGKKAADIIVNISNDGWFVWNWRDGLYRGSAEHPQHLSQYCFRAVENRTPVVRAVNTGISGSIDSAGRIVATVDQLGLRTMVAGTLLLDGRRDSQGEMLAGHGPKILVDQRVSLYSLVGDVFAQMVSLVAVGLMIVLLVKRPAGKRKKGEE